MRGEAPTLVVHFHKQVQIAVADLWAALGRRRLAAAAASVDVPV